MPGIGFSPDKMLQGRIFAYNDAQRYRIGTNYAQLAVNAPNYEPSTVEGAPLESPRHREPALDLGPVAADRYSHRDEDDHYSQPGALFRLMSPAQQQLLIDAIAGSMAGVARPGIIERQLVHFRRVDARLEHGIAAKLGRAATSASPAARGALA